MRKKPVFAQQEVNDKKVIIYYQAKPVSFFSYNCYRLDKKSLKDRIREKNLDTETETPKPQKDAFKENK